MTYEEAIEEILWVEQYGFIPDNSIIGTSRIKSAFQVAIEAIEKQIAKKVDTGKSRIFGCKLCGYGMGDVYIDDEFSYPIEPMFCPYCGQAIDWSANEKT